MQILRIIAPLRVFTTPVSTIDSIDAAGDVKTPDTPDVVVINTIGGQQRLFKMPSVDHALAVIETIWSKVNETEDGFIDLNLTGKEEGQEETPPAKMDAAKRARK